jgi:pimeloyl-ACP methyl ester carboxylesterase
LPKALAHSNAELLALRRELEELGNGLGWIRAPVTILQGLHDTLVPAESRLSNDEIAVRCTNGSFQKAAPQY